MVHIYAYLSILLEDSVSSSLESSSKRDALFNDNCAGAGAGVGAGAGAGAGVDGGGWWR